MNRFKHIILFLIKPFLKLASNVHVPYSRPFLNWVTVAQIEDELQIGDVLLSSTAGEMTNIFEPFKKYRHTAVYTGEGFVIEATGKGVDYKNIDQFLWEKQRVCIRRSYKAIDKAKLRQFAVNQWGKNYDFSFINGSSSWYCSELAYAILNAGIADWKFTQRKIWGEKTIIPMDFYHADQHFKTIYEVD